MHVLCWNQAGVHSSVKKSKLSKPASFMHYGQDTRGKLQAALDSGEAPHLTCFE